MGRNTEKVFLSKQLSTGVLSGRVVSLAAPPGGKMKFSRRIQAISNILPQCGYVVEIGCDHGKVLLCILISGKANKGLACDISEKSLNKARELYQAFPQYDIRTICCDGLEKAAGADCAVIAGIGGINITQILGNNPGVPAFVLQPSDNAAQLREYLCSNGYGIIDEEIVYDSRYYSLIYAELAEPEPLSRLQLELGPRNMEKDNCRDYARWRQSIYRKALSVPVENDRGRRAQQEIREALDLLDEYLGEEKCEDR